MKDVLEGLLTRALEQADGDYALVWHWWMSELWPDPALGEAIAQADHEAQGQRSFTHLFAARCRWAGVDCIAVWECEERIDRAGPPYTSVQFADELPEADFYGE